MDNRKHAYLIITHANFDYLKLLIKKLDSPNNDFFVLIDKKSKCDLLSLKMSVSLSKIFIVKRMKIYWGDYSQIKAEMLLFQNAVKQNHYSYYHLLSGVDIILKSKEEIFSFFDENAGYEFVEVNSRQESGKYHNRLRYFFFFEKGKSREKGKLRYFLNQLSLHIQYFIGTDRLRNKPFVYKGSNWVSITDEFANYIVNNFKKYKHMFKYSTCGDAMFVQTLIMDSPFKDKVYPKGNLRKIDWKRGRPYSWQEKDFDELMSSGCLFARKIENSSLYNKIFNAID